MILKMLLSLVELLTVTAQMLGLRQRQSDRDHAEAEGAALAENATLKTINEIADAQAAINSSSAPDPLDRARQLRADAAAQSRR